jgi:hypothetical protein
MAATDYCEYSSGGGNAVCLRRCFQRQPAIDLLVEWRDLYVQVRPGDPVDQWSFVAVVIELTRLLCISACGVLNAAVVLPLIRETFGAIAQIGHQPDVLWVIDSLVFTDGWPFKFTQF